MSKLGSRLDSAINVGNISVVKEDLEAVMFTVNVQIAAASVDTYIFIAPVDCKVLKISEIHTTKGADASAVSATVKKVLDTKGIADASSKDLLATTKIDLKGDNDTVQAPALTATAADLLLEAGDLLAIDFTGTLTTLAGGVVTVELEQA